MTKNPEEDIISERSNDLTTTVDEPNSKAERSTDNTSTSSTVDTLKLEDQAEDTFVPTEKPIKPEDPTQDDTNIPIKADGQAETPTPADEPTKSENQAEDSPHSTEDPNEPVNQGEDTDKPIIPQDEGDNQVAEDKDDYSWDGEPDLSDMASKGDSTGADARMENAEMDGAATGVSKTEDKAEDASADESRASAVEVGPGADGNADVQHPPTAESVAQATYGEKEEPTEDDSANTNDEEKMDLAAPATEKNSDIHVAQENKYDDDFSEISEISDRGAAATTVTAATVATESTQGEVEPQHSKSPTPSSNEEARAEPGAVVPVPVPARRSDGRSMAEERGELRGEDRNEVQADDGEDARGQGQWKSEEELFLQSSLMNQQAEKEALQAVIDQKVKVQKEYDDLQGRYMTLEERSKQWKQNTDSLKQKLQEQALRINNLETEEARLREFEQWGKDNEAKVKDLQERLATLAREDAEKDRQIQKLQEELQETRSRLVTTERQVATSNEAIAQLQRPAQQSKTCTIL